LALSDTYSIRISVSFFIEHANTMRNLSISGWNIVICEQADIGNIILVTLYYMWNLRKEGSTKNCFCLFPLQMNDHNFRMAKYV
jgi:hypothetical protein